MTGAGEKVNIYLFDGNFSVIIEQIEDALVARDPQIFQNQGRLYLKTQHGSVRANADLLRVRATQVIDFCRLVKKPDYGAKLVDPPLKYFSALLRKGEWKFPAAEADRAGDDR